MNQTLPPTEGDERGDPEWLRQLRGWEKTPDWLRRLIRSEQEALELAAADRRTKDATGVGAFDADRADVAEVPGPVNASDLADTLELVDAITTPDDQGPDVESEQAPGVPPSPEESALPPTPEEEDLDWLRALEMQESGAEASSAPEEASEEEIPTWLQRMSPFAELEAEEEEEGIADSTSPLEMEGVEIPDWLQDLSPETAEEAVDDQVPEWLAELDQAYEVDLEDELVEALGQATTTPETPIEAEEEAETPGAVATPAPGAEDELEGGVPLDLELAESIPAAEEMEPPPAAGAEPGAGEPEEEAPDLAALYATEADEFPDWLIDMAEEESSEAQEIVSEEGEPAGVVDSAQELPTVKDILGEIEDEGEGATAEREEAVEWLYETEQEPPPEEPILDFAEEEILQEEMPEWIDELRVEELAEEEQPASAETSGPLAGLRGLINPDPLFGLTPGATSRATLSVPDAQEEQARQLRQFLAAPSKRPEVTFVSPGGTVQERLGRWLIYVALLIAICAGMFVPALQELIQPAQTAEAAAFYSAVNNLPSGSEVLLVVDYDASHDGELTPQARAILWHLMDRDLGVIIVSHTPQGAAIVEGLLRDERLSPSGKPYIAGQNYLNLGYMPAHAALLQAFMVQPLGGVALWGASQEEAAQTPLGQRVSRFGDLDLIVLVSSNQEHVRWWVEQTATGSDQPPIVAGVSASAAPQLLPYYVNAEEGQIEGMLIGLYGAAAYEQLTSAPFWPSARENVILVGCAQLLFAAIVLASGIRSLFGRSRGT